jgi:hypothetical protein
MAEIKGSIKGNTVTKPDPKKKGKTITVKDEFAYVELKSTNSRGGGNRGIKIWLKGSRNVQEYKFDPNPHANHTYNQGQQETFYEEVAEALKDLYYADGEFPDYGSKSVRALSNSYRLVSW